MDRRKKRSSLAVMQMFLGNDPVQVDGTGLITFDANGEAVESLKVYFDPVQSFNGYDHPWPAGGGKNMLDPDYRSNLTSNIRFYYNTDGILLKANTPYTFGISSPSAQNSINEIGGTSLAANYGQSSLTYTPTNDVFVWFDVYYAGNYPVPSGGTSAVDCQLEEGFIATAWTPFENVCPITGWTGLYVYHSGADTSDYDTIPVTWSDHGTVYGGYVDVVTGDLWATVGSLTKNTADMNNSSEYPGWRNSGIKALIGEGVNGRIDNVFSNVSPDTGGVASIGANTLGSSDILILFENYFDKTQEDWIALSMDVQVCVPLATPVLVATLTPLSLDLLQGENNIWSNTGGYIELTYIPS